MDEPQLPAAPASAAAETAAAKTTLVGKYGWKLFVLPLVAALVVTLLVLWWRGPLLVAESVIQRDFIQTVVASGHVETAHRVDIGTQITGTVVAVPVAEGQSVVIGDLLIGLESSELRASEAQAELAAVQAQARLRQLHEVQAPVAEQTLRQAQTNLDNARTQLRRNQDLLRKGFISAAALDELSKAVDLADAQVRSNQKQVDSTRASGSDYAVAAAAVAEAHANTQAASARTRYAKINAPLSGVLIGRSVEVGDVVQPGKVLMTLSPGGRTQLVVDIDEKNLGLLALGQPALVSADAYPQQRFAAQLAYINPGINMTTGAVAIKLDVPAPPSVLKQDMTVSVDIEVARRPNAVLVPTSAVHDAEGVQPWVLHVEDHHAIRRVVRLGLRSGGFAEVLEGLQNGDRVISTTATTKAGARIRITTPQTTSSSAPATRKP